MEKKNSRQNNGKVICSYVDSPDFVPPNFKSEDLNNDLAQHLVFLKNKAHDASNPISQTTSYVQSFPPGGDGNHYKFISEGPAGKAEFNLYAAPAFNHFKRNNNLKPVQVLQGLPIHRKMGYWKAFFICVGINFLIFLIGALVDLIGGGEEGVYSY